MCSCGNSGEKAFLLGFISSLIFITFINIMTAFEIDEQSVTTGEAFQHGKHIYRCEKLGLNKK